jgi:hypothetical protein
LNKFFPVSSLGKNLPAFHFSKVLPDIFFFGKLLLTRNTKSLSLKNKISSSANTP